jgi:hypothetical protein
MCKNLFKDVKCKHSNNTHDTDKNNNNIKWWVIKKGIKCQ